MTVNFDMDDDPAGALVARTGSYKTGFAAEYAAPVNYGSEAHWPPLTPMLEWTDRMGWDNPGLDASMSEGDMWDEVDRRQSAGEDLPAAYHLAAHIAEHGTDAMMYGSDAFEEAARTGEAWAERQGYDGDNPDVILRDFGSWTVSLAIENIIERVSPASKGGLIQSAIDPPVPEDD